MKPKDYIELVKPERTLVNVMTAAAGFLFASRWHFTLSRLIFLLFGTALVIASGCVVNNYLDRNLDKKMKRTAKRVLASSGGAKYDLTVIFYSLVLLGLGLVLLAQTNWLTFGIGIEAYLSYVFVYGLAKRKTVYGTLIGTLPGGSSLVAGYTAQTGRLDLTALILFVIMLCWQMAHFFSIAIYRYDDYKNAGLPVMPVKRGLSTTKRQVILYILAFGIANVCLFLAGKVGYTYLIIMAGAVIWWLKIRPENKSPKISDKEWGRQLFSRSLTVITLFAVMLTLGSILV